MGNKTGVVWYRKTTQQKQKDIQKHFFKSPFPELERRIKQVETNIEACKEKIGKFRILIRPLFVQEETLRTKDKIKEIKEKIKKVQEEIIYIKAKRRGREDRKEIKEIKKWLKYEKELLTKEEMISIIKRGV